MAHARPCRRHKPPKPGNRNSARAAGQSSVAAPSDFFLMTLPTPMSRLPVLFLSHGSPMTALGGDELNSVWENLAPRLRSDAGLPAAILMVSAHWTTRIPMLSGASHPATMHDFGGFPDELYRLHYPAPGAPDLALRIKRLLSDNGIAAGIDASRGLDHGAWVPLRTLFPAAEVPVLQLSVQADRCARHHLALGSALAPLRDENILIVASGHMTHNLMEYMYQDGSGPTPVARAFRDFVNDKIINGDIESLQDWPHTAPGALSAHPTPEHFLPLFVALGAAGPAYRSEWLGGGWVGESIAADNYLFTSDQDFRPASTQS